MIKASLRTSFFYLRDCMEKRKVSKVNVSKNDQDEVFKAQSNEILLKKVLRERNSKQ